MIKPERVYEVFGITDGLDFDTDPIQSDENIALLENSPEMLVALVNIEIDSCGICDSVGYEKEICGNCKHAKNKQIIESADSKGRKWPELLKELKE